MAVRIEHFIGNGARRISRAEENEDDLLLPSEKKLSKSVQRSLRERSKFIMGDYGGIQFNAIGSQAGTIAATIEDGQISGPELPDTNSPKAARKETLENLGLESEENISEFRELSKTGTDIFEWFKKTPQSGLLYKELVNRSYAHSKADRDEGKDLINHFAGAVFQSMGFAYILGHSSNRDTILSPKETFLKYADFFPGVPVVTHPFGMDSITHVSVPDGLKMDYNNKIIAVFEYTLSKDRDHLKTKVHAFSLDKKDSDGNFSNPKLVFVAVRDARSLFETVEENKERADIDIIQMPFTAHEFRFFIDDILEHQPNDDSAGVNDILREVELQSGKKTKAVGIKEANLK